MHEITTFHDGIPLGTTRECLVGTPVTIESDTPIARIELNDQPGGEPATITTNAIVCHLAGSHSFLVHFDDGHTGALRLRAHH